MVSAIEINGAAKQHSPLPNQRVDFHGEPLFRLLLRRWLNVTK